MTHSNQQTWPDFCASLSQKIPEWAKTLGFQEGGITDTHLENQRPALESWLKANYHGDMAWMAEHAEKRLHPEKLHTGTTRIISVRMNYLPPDTAPVKILKSSDQAYLSRYALGRDYHKLIRKRLAKLGDMIEAACKTFFDQQNHQTEASFTDYIISQRPFVDSAPVLERPLAEKAGLGWQGKHSLILNKHAGSWFFLGELFTNIPLTPTDKPVENQCGSCEACLKVCPTDAFPKPYVLDARRCISYLTIENKDRIPEVFREPIGNRVFGCDDCQLICPWNKFAPATDETDFTPRHQLEDASLRRLFLWDEKTFLDRTAGSPIRRIGYERWQRNLAVGLGNAKASAENLAALHQQSETSTELVREHIQWAIAQHNTPNKKRKRKIKRP